MFQVSKVNCSPSFIDLQDLKDTYESVWLTKSVGLHNKQLIKKKSIRNSLFKIFRNFQTIDFLGHTSEQLHQCNHDNRVKTQSATASAEKYVENLGNLARNICREDT